MSKEKSKKKFTIHHQPAIAACWLMMNSKIYCVDNQRDDQWSMLHPIKLIP